MKNISMWIATGSLLASLNVNAQPTTFLDSLDLGPAVDMTDAKPGRACADFSGSWKGACKVGAETSKEETFTLAQKGCEYIQVTSGKINVKLPIGGTFSAEGAIPGTPAKAFGGNICSNWNAEQTVLQVHTHGGKKNLTINEMGNGAMMKQEMSMKDGKLVVTLEGVVSQAGAEKKFNGECEFIRQ